MAHRRAVAAVGVLPRVDLLVEHPRVATVARPKVARLLAAVTARLPVAHPPAARSAVRLLVVDTAHPPVARLAEHLPAASAARPPAARPPAATAHLPAVATAHLPAAVTVGLPAVGPRLPRAATRAVVAGSTSARRALNKRG